MAKLVRHKLPWILSSMVVISLHIGGGIAKSSQARGSDGFQVKAIQAPSAAPNPPIDPLEELYINLHLEQKGLSLDAWQAAIHGYNKLRARGYYAGAKRITIVDFSQPSSRKRLYIVDLAKSKLLFHSWVAHGQNSGTLYARQFSNTPESFQSSPGFYQTGLPYVGKNGLSLKLRGLEPGINDRAEERAIVMHGADYVRPDILRSQGYLGRSWGCPAVLPELNTKIIRAIQAQTCLFIYTPDQQYLAKSVVLNGSGEDTKLGG
jgi:hypothetical protein